VLGFYNVLTEEYSIRPFASLLLRAHRSPEQPHFAILDEMNLARVEHYFADLLSATESRTVKEGKLRQEAVHLHDDARCLPMAKPKNWNRPEKCGACKATTEEVAACDLYFDNVQMVPPNLPVPANVYITGTVNIDETTHMFSPKVLDRANVIEFNEVDLLGYGQTNPSSEFMLDNGDIDLGKATVAQQEHFKNAPEKVQTTLAALNQLLAESNLHFGYRVANEISLYVTHAVTFVGTNAVDAALDLQVLQKVLPKLHGSKQKLLGPLWRLLVFAVWGNSNPIPYSDQEFEKIQSSLANSASMPAMPRTAAKLARMLRVLRSQGFVSFIE
jgi:5-methylcytosine-specific restriction endonuclease McrBC GTP-binding regulatory subunit McrB